MSPLFGGSNDAISRLIEQDIKELKKSNDKIDVKLLRKTLRSHWALEKHIHNAAKISKNDVRLVRKVIQHMKTMGIPANQPSFRRILLAEKRMIILAKELIRIDQQARTNL